jgi:sulfate transport system permease protein
MSGRVALRVAALGYLALIVLAPVAMIVARTFAHGLAPVVAALTTPEALHAIQLSLLVTAIVVPINTVFGVICAFVLVRYRPPGSGFISAVLDLPFAVSPVVLGLALVALYGAQGWFGPWLSGHDIHVIFALPGMVLATVFVSLPFVVNEVVPVLAEAGTDAEDAAATLGAGPWRTFRRVTLPAIRWGVTYGVVLTTARALGEYGAVAIVSGSVLGVTQTLPLYVEDRFVALDLTGAFAAGLLLGLVAVAVLVVLTRLGRRLDRSSLDRSSLDRSRLDRSRTSQEAP